jgi:hypothetical protein
VRDTFKTCKARKRSTVQLLQRRATKSCKILKEGGNLKGLPR